MKIKQNSRKDCCKVCFNSLNDLCTLNSLLKVKNIICNSCKNKFKILYEKQIINGVETLFLYEYNYFMRKLIYQYKGCYDIELKDVFLNEYKAEINKKYKDYIIVYPPSSDIDDQLRGFKHVAMMVSCLKLKSQDLFYKKIEYKQSSHHLNERKNIENIILLKNKTIDKTQKFLIVDDIYTSGSTLKTIIKLLEKNNVKKSNIKALIISKTTKNVEL